MEIHIHSPHVKQLREQPICTGDRSGGDKKVRVLRVRGLLEHFFELFDLAPRDAADHKDDQVLVVRRSWLGMETKLAVRCVSVKLTSQVTMQYLNPFFNRPLIE